jgi:hypothetical protein
LRYERLSGHSIANAPPTGFVAVDQRLHPELEGEAAKPSRAAHLAAVF